jgi:hypothetical protein
MSDHDHNKGSKKTGTQDFAEFAKQFEPLIKEARARRKKMLWTLAIVAFAGTFITGYVTASAQAGFCFFILAIALVVLHAERTRF